MTRIRMLLIATGLSIATLMLLTETQAQGPGGRGNRGGGGAPGGFGGGGPGGFGGGGRGGSSFYLLASPQVQADLKVTDAQVTKLESVRKKSDDARQKLFAGMRGNRGGRGGNNNNNADAADPNGGGQPDFQAIRQTMTDLQDQTEDAYSKILTPVQVNRLGQIALQQQGIFAVIRPELIEKLNMSEDQVVQIREIQNEMRQEQRKARTNQRDVFGQFRTPNGGVDVASLRDKMDSPEFKVQVAANNKAAEEAEKVQQQATAAVGKVLLKKQKESYNRMIGAPFDTTKMTFNRDGTFISPTGSTVAASSAPSASTRTAAAAADAEDDAPAAKTSAPAAAAKKKTGIRARRNDD